jgi:hypothetical protein
MSTGSSRFVRSPAYDVASSSSFDSNASYTEFASESARLDWEISYDNNAVLYPGLDRDEGALAGKHGEDEEMIVVLREENERLRQRLVNMEKMEKEKREEAESLKAQVFKIRSRLRLIIHINTSRINY